MTTKEGMAKEIAIIRWKNGNLRRENAEFVVPDDFAFLSKGNSRKTLFLKRNAESIFVVLERTKYGAVVVGYYGPIEVVRASKLVENYSLQELKRRGELEQSIPWK